MAEKLNRTQFWSGAGNVLAHELSTTVDRGISGGQWREKWRKSGGKSEGKVEENAIWEFSQVEEKWREKWRKKEGKVEEKWRKRRKNAAEGWWRKMPVLTLRRGITRCASTAAFMGAAHECPLIFSIPGPCEYWLWAWRVGRWRGMPPDSPHITTKTVAAFFGLSCAI